MNKFNFSAEYSDRSDDELLLLASDRDSLTGEAAAALDVELRQRNLTRSDQVKYQQFVKRNKEQEARENAGGYGRFYECFSWVDLFCALVA